MKGNCKACGKPLIDADQLECYTDACSPACKDKLPFQLKPVNPRDPFGFGKAVGK